MLHNSDYPARSNPLLSALYERESSDSPIRVGVVGAGAYGRTLISQVIRCRGILPSVVCDLNTNAAFEVLSDSGVEVNRAPSTSSALLRDAVLSGRVSVTDDLSLLADVGLDVIVDCTGRPETGAQCARVAAAGGSSLVMVNVEADSAIGCEAAESVEAAGGVYTLADGDQPSLMVGLADWASTIGFEVVAAGKWTDAYTSTGAQQLLARWEAQGKNIVESDITYLDGSKAQMELASAANCLAFGCEKTGTVGESLSLSQIPERVRVTGPAPLLSEEGTVDYVNCDGVPEGECYPGGVFIVAKSDNRAGMEAMARKYCVVSDDRTHVLFYRPYHLIGVETVWSIVRAVIDRVPTAAPRAARSVEVVAVAKSSLKSGTVLAGLGGDVRGVMVRSEEAAHRGLLPFSLAAGCTLIRGCEKGEVLSIKNVEAPRDSECLRLRPALFGDTRNVQ